MSEQTQTIQQSEMQGQEPNQQESTLPKEEQKEDYQKQFQQINVNEAFQPQMENQSSISLNESQNQKPISQINIDYLTQDNDVEQQNERQMQSQLVQNYLVAQEREKEEKEIKKEDLMKQEQDQIDQSLQHKEEIQISVQSDLKVDQNPQMHLDESQLYLTEDMTGTSQKSEIKNDKVWQQNQELFDSKYQEQAKNAEYQNENQKTEDQNLTAQEQYNQSNDSLIRQKKENLEDFQQFQRSINQQETSMKSKFQSKNSESQVEFRKQQQPRENVISKNFQPEQAQQELIQVYLKLEETLSSLSIRERQYTEIQQKFLEQKEKFKNLKSAEDLEALTLNLQTKQRIIEKLMQEKGQLQSQKENLEKEKDTNQNYINSLYFHLDKQHFIVKFKTGVIVYIIILHLYLLYTFTQIQSAEFLPQHHQH